MVLLPAQTTLTSLSVHLKESGWLWAAEEKNKMINLPPNLKKKKKKTTCLHFGFEGFPRAYAVMPFDTVTHRAQIIDG